MDQATNRTLTEVGPGTPMGNLLRRYWMPIAGVSEFDERRTKPVRLMGEDLVLYKDLSGRFGLVQRRCAHRRADLAYGYVEADGLRCNYHGWLYNAEGRCIAMPFEDLTVPGANLKDKICLTAYPVETKGGLVWAYLGPQPAPILPDWEPFNWKNGFVQIVTADIPCNWLQCQENSIDPAHFEWTHTNWSIRLKDKSDGPFKYGPRHLKLDFEEFEFGYLYKRVREDTTEQDDLWTVGRVFLWPNGFYLGEHFEWRVPVDDENTLSITWAFTRVPNEREPYRQNAIPTWKGPITDPATGDWITSHVMNQDFVAWVGQGTIADRTEEHLAHTDRGVSMVRRQFLKDIKAIEEGRDPKGLIRDPARASNVPLPAAEKRFYVEGLPMAEMRKLGQANPLVEDYVFQAGQPKAVRRAFREAMGLPAEG
jgi:5,5'-dehydrodivanillate O-demethylase